MKEDVRFFKGGRPEESGNHQTRDTERCVRSWGSRRFAIEAKVENEIGSSPTVITATAILALAEGM